MISEHNQAVTEFMKSCREQDPTKYDEVCQRNPVIGQRQWRRIREREIAFSSSEFEDLYASDTRLDQEE